MKKVHRQGDVVFVPRDAAVEGEVKKDGVISEGETTGHAHRSTSELRVWDGGMSIIPTSPVTHEEHHDIVIHEPHDVGMQEEYDWFNKVARKVVD